jgi:hypothetical protein
MATASKASKAASKPPPSPIEPTEPEPPVDVESNGHSPEAEVPEPEAVDLVNLSPTRRLVKIPTRRKPGGEEFELRLVEDFGIERQQQLMAWSRRFQALMSQDEDLTASETSRLRFLLENITEAVLDCPKSVLTTLTDTVKNRVVQAFSWGPALAQQEQQTELVRRLIEKKYVTEDQVDEVMAEIRKELLASISES